METLYTDYPFVELGDTPGEEAPIREVIPTSWDDNKYCDVVVDGISSNIKRGYIYTERGRCGDVPMFDPEEYMVARILEMNMGSILVGMEIKHKWYDRQTEFKWYAKVLNIDEDKNELKVQIFNDYGHTFETWNLAHTRSGLNMGEYKRKTT